MNIEQKAILEYRKGNTSQNVCANTLLESLNITHPTLYMLLCKECTDECIIKLAMEVFNYKEPLPLNSCPECMTDAYGYTADNTNLAECNRCGTFFKLRKH